MGKIFVTGGAGYIGSHVVKELGAAGFSTITYDNLSTGFRESVVHGEFIEGDLADLDKLDAIFSENKIDGVIHFAGSIVVPESVENPEKYYHNNSTNSLNLIRLCKKHNIPRFIFSSTAATYGMGNGDDLPVLEEHPTNPINPYGRSKLMTEWMLKDSSYANQDFNFIALRYFNVAGADPEGQIGQRFPGATHLIKVSLQAALGKRDHVSIFGTDYETKDGTGVRDYIHVTDLANAHVKAMEYLLKNKESHIFNCGYGKGFSVREVIETVRKVSGVDFKVTEDPRRAGDPALLIANSDKIRKVLDWTPKHDDLEKIIETAWNWEKSLV